MMLKWLISGSGIPCLEGSRLVEISLSMKLKWLRGFSAMGMAVMALLVLMLVAFVVGHFASSGEIWNHATGELFSPLENYVSDYAYRSSAWPLFVGCIYSMGVILGVMSWRFFSMSPEPTPMAWMTSVLLAYSGLKFVEVAVYPVKPPEVSAEGLQSRMDKSSWERLKTEVWQAWEKTHGRPMPEGDRAWDVVNAFGMNTGHLSGIRGALLAMAVAISLATTMKMGKRRRWIGVSLGALSLIVAGMVGVGHELSGLWQRIAFMGVYLWLWLGAISLFPKNAD